MRADQPGSADSIGVKDARPAGGGSPPRQGEPPDRTPGPAAHRRRPSAKRRTVEWLVILAIALVVALVLRLFVVQTFYIPSGSMLPTLQIGDRIVVDKLAYHLHGVGRGDIIVFRAPAKVATVCKTNDTDLVKRVIGLPGETISDKNGTVYVNGKVLPQPWLPKHDPMTFTAPFGPVKIGPQSYFVMGDNRVDSCDSRFWGTVNRSLIVGKVDMRIWPLGRIAFF